MAIKSVKESFAQRRSTFRDGKLVHIRCWIITCDSGSDGTAVAITAGPGPGSRHNKDTTAVLSGLEAAPHENSDRIFELTAEYTTLVFGLPPNPLDRAAEISYGNSGEATEPYFLDCSKPDPKPTVNSAGDTFESFLERDAGGEFVLTITVNEATFSPPLMESFKNTLNQDAIYIDGITYAPGTLKLSCPTAQRIIETTEGEGGTKETFTYYKVTYTVKARHSWDDVVSDVGMNEFIPDPNDAKKPGKVRPIVDSAQLPIKKPWPLDGAGKRKTNPQDRPADLTFKPYKTADWSGLKPFQPETWGQPRLAT